MKKFSIIICIALVLFLLAACGEAEEVPVATPEPTVEVTPTPEPTPEPEYEYAPEFVAVSGNPEYMIPFFFAEGEGWYASGSDFNAADGTYSSKLCLVSPDGKVTDAANAKEGFEISGAAGTADGKVIWIESAYEEDGMTYYVVSKDSRNKIANENGFVFDASSMQTDESGNVLLLADNSVVTVSQSGETVSVEPCEGMATKLIKLADGSVAAVAWQGEQLTVGGSAVSDSASAVFSGFGPNLYCYNDNIRFCTDGGDLFNWTSVDISVDEVEAVAGGDQLHCFLGSWDTENNCYSYELATVTCYIKGTAPAKQTLTLAALDADYDLQNMIVRFNRFNPDFRIELQIVPEDEIEACDADIISLDGLDYRTLAESGKLEDLLPYLGDGASAIFPNILDALEVDGKLYSTNSGFSITALMGYAGIVGGRIGWTYDDYFAVLNTVPAGESLFDPETATRADVLRDYLGTMKSVDTGSEEYQKAVEVADTVEGEPAATQLLRRISLFSYDDIILNDLEFDGNAVYVGLPVSEGNGNLLVLFPGFAMSSSCGNKDLAWQFLGRFFTEEYQSKQWYFPGNMNAFSSGLAAAQQEQYEEDEKLPRAVSYSAEGAPTYYYAISWHQAQELQEIVSGAKVFINSPKIEETLN